MTNTTWLVTGASRGIGLELTRQILQIPTNTIFAACRSPSTATELAALISSPGILHIVKLDVADEASIKACTDEVLRLLDGAGLDYVLNNAAINHVDLAFSFTPADLVDTINTNVIGPALISRYLLPAIEKSNRRVIMNMSSSLASIVADPCGPRSTSYSISKAAINMLTYKQARERPDLIPIAMDPGWVKTDMGTMEAALEPHESVTGILNVLQNATQESAGKYLGYHGNEVPR